MIILYVRYRTVRGGFWQNELILEFPTKSIPSGFRAAAIAIIRLFPRNRGEATVHCVSSFAGAGARVRGGTFCLLRLARPRGAVTGEKQQPCSIEARSPQQRSWGLCASPAATRGPGTTRSIPTSAASGARSAAPADLTSASLPVAAN